MFKSCNRHTRNVTTAPCSHSVLRIIFIVRYDINSSTVPCMFYCQLVTMAPNSHNVLSIILLPDIVTIGPCSHYVSSTIFYLQILSEGSHAAIMSSVSCLLSDSHNGPLQPQHPQYHVLLPEIITMGPCSHIVLSTMFYCQIWSQ